MNLMNSEDSAGNSRNVAGIRSLLTGRSDQLAWLIIAAIGLLIYANNYQVPWYLDDVEGITANRLVQDSRDLAGLLSSRGPAIASFVLNYTLHGEDIFGFHLVNNLIHIFTAIFVYHILKRVMDRWALAGALIFLCHPLQTGAVTYIVQRMSSLCGLFLFISLFACIRARETAVVEGTMRSLRYCLWYSSMLLFCFLAILTKQNAVFLPVGMVLFDRYFINDSFRMETKKRLLFHLPFFLLAIVYSVIHFVKPLLSGVQAAELSAFTGAEITPLQYLVTEFSVVWIYIRMLFIPYGLTLDHGYPFVSSLITMQSSIALLGLFLLAAFAWRVRNSLPFISFGICWFFVSLAVESSIIPLDAMFEHRLYIPMFGFVIVLIDLIKRLITVVRLQYWCVIFLIILYSLLTIQRNSLWAEPIAFYEDNLRKSPHNLRVYTELAYRYIVAKRYPEAEELLLKAAVAAPLSAEVYSYLGILYSQSGHTEKSISAFKHSISLDTGYLKAYRELAVVYSKIGEYGLAEGLLRKAMSSPRAGAPEFYNLGVVLYRMERKSEAAEVFYTAVKLSPYDSDALYNYGLVKAELGDFDEAHRMVEKVRAINPTRGGELLEEVKALQNRADDKNLKK